MDRIDLIGIGADGLAGLRSELVERINAAAFLAGGERQHGYFPFAAGKRFVIKDNLAELAGELRKWSERTRVVLASGDPLFFGIGAFLAEQFGSEALRVEPAVSSMQLAFARAGVPWHDAALASIHGRDLRAALLPLLGRRRIGLFTQDGDSPAAVARYFLRAGLAGYAGAVGEQLGGSDERFTRWNTLAELAEQSFGPLNVLILLRTESVEVLAERDRLRGLAPGIPDEAFARPGDAPEVMTRQEVRAVTLAKLLGPTQPGDVAWDVGAGLGTVAVELAVLRPGLEVVAVERDPARAGFLKQNRERFDAYNIRVIEGAAPDCLKSEELRPRLAFLGGSGQQLPAILDLVHDRLLPGGRLVANFVTLENLALAMQRLRDWRWAFEVAEISVARGDSLAGLTGLKPLRGVFVVSADRPREGEDHGPQG